MQTLSSMMKYIRKHMKLWLCGLLIPAFASLATNIFYANRLQNYSEQLMGTEPSLSAIAIMLAVTVVVLLILSGIDDVGRYVFALFSVSTENEIKHDYYGRLVHASLQALEKFNQGELISRYNEDITQSTSIVSYDIHGVIYPLIVGIGYLTAVLTADIWIGSIMLVLGIGVIIFNFLFLKKLIRIQKEILQANEAYVLHCTNAIHGKMSIRQYCAKDMMAAQMKLSASQLARRERQRIRIQALKILTSDGLANICTYLLAPIACVFAVYGYLSVPVVLFIHQICRCFIQYTQNFAGAFIQYQLHALSYERLDPILNLADEAQTPFRRAGAADPAHNGITFDAVNVFYGDKHVLKDVSFSIHPGEIVGLVGESGSGKSTLIKALLQLVGYEGHIFIGGVDCAYIPLDRLRSLIALSPEHSDLFHTTVHENIQFGSPDASETELFRAVNKAAITDAEAFLDRDAGENGERLSGGQKQKVSIARALLKNAPIIVLDEPTAALDAHSEAKVLDTIQELGQEGKCILLITHKASTLRIADRIMHIENGKVHEQ